jgi:hypothetical protein
MSKRRLKLIDLPAREQIKLSKVEGILYNGEDNAYPTRIDRLIEGSVTAKAASEMLARFLVGDGFADARLSDIVVGYHNYRPVTAYKLLGQIAKSMARYNGFFVRAQFNPALETTSFKLYNFGDCRFSKPDDINYSGKVVVYNNWDKSQKSRIEKQKFLLLDVWNPEKPVLINQVKNAGDINTFKGQMFFEFIDDDYVYPLAPIDVAQYDADSEDQVSKFKNGELRRGFFPKYIIHHTFFDSDEAADEFKEMLQEFNGGDHEKSALLCEGTFDENGKLKEGENIKIETLTQNINDKQFEQYERSWANNIRKAFDAIPQLLIEYETSQLGTTSGEAIKMANDYFNLQTEHKRTLIAQSFKAMFKNFKDASVRDADFSIKPLKFVKDEPIVE